MSTRHISRKGRELSAKQIRFAHEYAGCLNGAESARRSGYAKGSADVTAARLLANPSVWAKIDALLTESLAAAKLSVAKVDEQLAAICFSNIRNYYDAQGRLRPVEQWPPGAAAALASLETREVRRGGSKAVIVRLKLCDKVAGLTLAARRLGLLKDKVEHSGRLTLAELVALSMEPRKEGEPK